MNQPNPSTDDRKSPKRANFPLVVALAAVALLAIMAAAVLFLHKDAGKVDPHGPTRTPNSLYQPPLPPAQTPAAAA